MKVHKVKDASDFKVMLSRLRESLFPKQEGEVWLYGSRARGDYDDNSDWDIIVLTDEEDSFFNFKKFAFPFIQLGIKYGQDVIPLLFSKKEWESKKNTLFYINVLTDRISI